MKIRLSLAGATTLALGMGAAPASAATQAPAPPCTVIAHQTSASPLRFELSADRAGCISPQVTLQAWYAPTADGRPLTSQQLVSTSFDGLLPPFPQTVVTTVHGLRTEPCYLQVDVAYGHARADLSTPYGSDLIRAWHLGSQDCVTPTPAPSASTPAPSAPAATSSAPTPSPSVTSPPLSTPPLATIPVVVPPLATSTGAPSPTPTKPRKVPRPTVTPTKTPSSPATTTTPPRVPTPSASGCVASGCDTAAPRPTKPELPYTGAEDVLLGLVAGALVATGGLILVALRYQARSKS